MASASYDTIPSTSQWLLQILLNLALLTIGFVAALRGTSLVSLAKVYDTSITVMGLSIVAAGIGGQVGCNIVGFVLDKFPHHQHVVMTILLMVSALGTLAMPFGQIVPIYCFANFLYGFGFAFSTVANALSFRMWRDSSFGAGPFVHSLFLFCLVGLFLSPIVSSPFLSHESEAKVFGNDSSLSMDKSIDNVTVAIPFIGSSVSYLFLSLLILHTGSVINGTKDNNEGELNHHMDIRLYWEEKMPSSYRWKRRTLVGIAASFYITDYAVIMGISNFLLLALEHGPLGIDNASGTLFISIFFLGQIIICAVNSILSSILNPYQILAYCLALIFASALLLWFFWETSYTLIEVSFFVLGLGSGPLYANTMVWLDQFIPVEAKTTGFLQSSSAVGMLIAGLIFGPYVEDYPEIFTYFIFAFPLALLLVFGSGEVLGRAVRRQRETEMEVLEANPGTNLKMDGKMH